MQASIPFFCLADAENSFKQPGDPVNCDGAAEKSDRMNGLELKVVSRQLCRRIVKIVGAAGLLIGFGQPAFAAPTQLNKITAPDGVSNDFFGYSVLLSEGDLFVGAQRRIDKNGAVYVYPAGRSYASPWSIIEPPSGNGNYFGTRILRQGDTLLISAQRSSAGAKNGGAVYVYEKDPESGVWNLRQTLVAQDAASDDWFGNAMAIHENELLIGAPRRDLGETLDAGSVYVFRRDAAGQWAQKQVLAPQDPTAQGFFGASVALQAGKALVGMPGHDTASATNVGLAYAFTAGGAGTWSLGQTLDAPEQLPRAGFGSAVAMASEQAVIAAPSGEDGGSVYALSQQGGSWSVAQRMVPEGGFQGLQFGFSVALSPNGQHLAVGAPGAVSAGFDAGEIHRYDAQAPGSFAVAGAPLVSEDLASRDFFGAAVCVTNDRTVVAGVRLDDDMGTSSGSAYIFGESEPAPAPVAPLGALLVGFGALLALRRTGSYHA